MTRSEARNLMQDIFHILHASVKVQFGKKCGFF